MTGEPPSTPRWSSLLVAAERALRQRLAALLERRGHRVTEVTTAAAVAAVSESAPFHLAVVRWGRGTRRVVEAIRAAPGGAETLIVALADRRQRNAPAAALQAGADDLEALPANPEDLLARVQILERRLDERADAALARRDRDEPASRAAWHDALTGLPDRTLFFDRLDQRISRARRRGHRFAVLLLDVDRFKLINDSLGHLVGDRLLVAIGQRLREGLREDDTVARLGGDEFALLLEEIEEVRHATQVADRILHAIRRPFDLDGLETFATASIGIVLGDERYARPEELLRDADTAMYRAKAQGRDGAAVFEPPMHERAVVLLELETDLRRAVEHDEFCVHYQPIVSLRTNRIAGMEALVRWRHPRRGLLTPADFLAVAEETNLIIPIDRWVLNEACRQLRAWHQLFRRQPPLTVSANISGSHLTRPDLIMQVDHALRTHGLYGRALKLEITESVVVETARYAADMLEHLRALDIALSIDDFGTGYSSLSLLRRFDFDTLKVDTSFVSRMLEDPESAEIVQTISNLAFNLGKDLVAEGVENAAQLQRLRQLGCAYAQGFFFSPALPASDATALLAQDPRW